MFALYRHGQKNSDMTWDISNSICDMSSFQKLHGTWVGKGHAKINEYFLYSSGGIGDHRQGPHRWWPADQFSLGGFTYGLQ